MYLAVKRFPTKQTTVPPHYSDEGSIIQGRNIKGTFCRSDTWRHSTYHCQIMRYSEHPADFIDSLNYR